MSSRIHPVACCLALLVSCALVACKPATPPAQEASPGTAATAPPTSADATSEDGRSGNARSKIAETAARMNPLTSPKDAIIAATGKFMAVRSFHASMQNRNGSTAASTNEIDFVAPDRFRMQMPMGTQVIIGDTMYVNADGRSMKIPLPKGTLSQLRNPAQLGGNEDTMTVESKGRDTVDGISADKYLVHNTQPQPSDVTIWVGDTGLPMQIQVSLMVQGQPATTTIRYTRFNDPTIRVEPPK